MKEHHILTVGISLLTNFARTRSLSLLEALKRHRELEGFLRADPVAACAELNSLDSRTEFFSGTNKSLAVTLVFSTTEPGKICASLIEKELKRRGVEVHKLPMKGFDAPARDFSPKFAAAEAAEALGTLRQRVTEHVCKLRTRSPSASIQFNCTGGYKAECAVLYEIGRTLRVPVYYLHETFKVAVELP